MKLPMKPSRNTRSHECGYPVDVALKKRLRNRSQPLTSDQRGVVKKMGIKPFKMVGGKKVPLTEKEAVTMIKRFVTGKSNYKIKGGVSLLERKRKTSKPKRITLRQAKMGAYIHRADNGSKRAEKMLNKL